DYYCLILHNNFWIF
nr:immunoglobulin light chain junction region [Macaca mulatta]